MMDGAQASSTPANCEEPGLGCGQLPLARDAIDRMMRKLARDC